MKTVNHIAKHYREVHFGGNWTTTNLKELLSDVTWEEATAKVANFNTIAALLYHIQYFTEAIIPVLQGQPLTAHDKFSYDVSAIESESAIPFGAETIMWATSISPRDSFLLLTLNM